MRFHSLIFLVLVCMALLNCRSNQGMPNVILIMVDTLRADHLGVYGYHRQTSPNLDAFAAENLVFLNHRSQAACTFPSVNSLLTSRFATEFYGDFMGIPQAVPSLPTLLSAHGYRTAAISASPIVQDQPTRFNPHGGFGNGFNEFLPNLAWAPAESLFQKAVESMAGKNGGYFLYLHFIDPHGPYAPPENYNRRFAKPHDGPSFILEGKPNPIEAMLFSNGPAVEFSAEDIQHLIDLYDDEIAYFDHWFGRLLAHMKAQPWWEDAIVLVVSDHGEAFMEHNQIKHCRCLYDHQTATPLIMKVPKGSYQGSRESLSQNLDVVPTVLELLKIAHPPDLFVGKSLVPIFEKEKEVTPYAFSAQSTYRSINDAQHKLIVNLGSGAKEFFNLSLDPNEKLNLAQENPREMEILASALSQWMEQYHHEGDLEKAKASQELLRSLGYIQ